MTQPQLDEVGAELKRLQGRIAELEQQNQRLSQLMAQTARAAQVGGWELDGRTGLLFWTDETYRLYERKPGEFTPTVEAVLAFCTPESVPLLNEAMRRAMDEGEPYDLELQVVTAGGRRIWIRATGAAEREEGKTIKLFGSFQDVTSRREAAEALRRSEEQQRRLIASSPDCQVELDLDGRLLSINPRGVELLELTDPVEVVGRPWMDLWPEGSRPLLLEAFEQARLGQEGRVQAFGPTVCGAPRWWDVEIISVRDSQGRTERLLAAVRDITPLKRAEAERQEFERNLQQTQKLESLGVLAGGIAHDFNNILTTILGYADLAGSLLPEGTQVQNYLEAIDESAIRAADLCQQMLAYAGKGRLIVEPLDLSTLVRDTAQLLQLSISKKAALTLYLASGLPAVMADVTQLRQVLMNLVINASEALGEEEGLIAVSTGRQHVDRSMLQSARPGSSLVEGEYIYLEVCDTGCGMDEQTQARIFEPFFTTKFAGRGLGLSAVQGIARGHQGVLQVKSAPGQGSTFRLLFPPTARPPAPPAKPRLAGHSWHGQGTILVVDDEEQVRSVADALVCSFGFHVIQAAHGREAIKKLTQHASQVRLVLLDLTMPRLDGEQTLIELRRIAPAVPVVLMSGYSERELSERFAGKGLAGFLQKPFTREDVRRRLRDALGE